MPQPSMGLIAGGGRLPFLLARAGQEAGWRVVAAGFAGNTDPELANHVDEYQCLKLGQLGKLLDFFQSRNVTRVVMGGAICKARAMDVRPDLKGAKLLFKLRGRSDDALLRGVIDELNALGMQVSRTHELLPELLTPGGVLCGKPDEKQWAEVRHGWNVAKAMGKLDVGQTVVVRRRVVAAVEALEGTDEAIRRGCALAGPGATVVKVFKPGQDERADLPAVGLATIQTMAEGKAACLAVEAGRSLFFQRAEALELARKAGIVVLGAGQDSAGIVGIRRD